MTQEPEKKPELFASKNFSKPAKQEIPPRLLGSILSIVGLGLCYWQIYLPLNAAQTHSSREISYDGNLQMFALMLVGVGLFLLVIGKNAAYLQNIEHNSRDKRFWLVIVLGVGFAIVGIAVDIWMKGEFARLGYSSVYR